MRWPPDIADDLPAPRDDEPASLRQDIVDELADHLQCAFTRELHLTRDELSAQEKALDRFGNPHAIARKLWFDALRDSIMSQRLTLAALILVALLCFGSAGATWFLLDQARQANEAMLSQSREATAEILSQSRDSSKALLEQSQKANESLIEKLGELSAVSRSETGQVASPEWNPVRCRLYTGEKPGQPAQGFQVTIKGFVLDTAKEVSVTRVTDAAGFADMGLMRPGQHQISVRAPWGDSRSEKLITVLPGKGLVEEIQCPLHRPEKTTVSFQIDWPDDFRSRGFWAVAHLKADPPVIGGQGWFASRRENECLVVLTPDQLAIPFPVHLNPRMAEMPGLFGRWPYAKTPLDSRGSQPGEQLGLASIREPDQREPASTGRTDTNAQRRQTRRLTRYAFIFDPNPKSAVVECESGEYRLMSFLITGAPTEIPERENPLSRLSPDFGKRPDREFSTELRALAVIGALMDPQTSDGGWGGDRQTKVFSPFTDWVDASEAWGPSSPGIPRVPSSVIDQQRLEAQPKFVAKPGVTNQWNITLPPRLLEKVRSNPDVAGPNGVEKTGAGNSSD